MFVPSFAAIGLLWTGAQTDPDALLEIQHTAMFPSMLAVMLLRRREYGGHRRGFVGDGLTTELPSGSMLIDVRGWEPEDEDEDEEKQRRSRPHVPWRPFAWIAAFAWLLVIAAEVDGFAGYGIFLVAVTLGSWRLERSARHWESGRAGDSGAWY